MQGVCIYICTTYMETRDNNLDQFIVDTSCARQKRAHLTTTTLCKHIHVVNLISWNKHERTYSTKHHLKLHIYVFVFFPPMRAMHFKLRLFHSSPTLWHLSQWSFAPGGAHLVHLRHDLICTYHVSNWQILNSHADFWRGASQTLSELHHVINDWYQLKQSCSFLKGCISDIIWSASCKKRPVST